MHYFYIHALKDTLLKKNTRSFWSAHSRHKHRKYELKLKNNNYNYVQFLLN